MSVVGAVLQQPLDRRGGVFLLAQVSLVSVLHVLFV